jgi:co-chaperonin GroES (HSP10)
MSLSAILGPGLVSIYGAGSSASSLTGMIVPNGSFFFGIVDQTWNGIPGNVSVGQSVLFQEGDVFTRLVYNNTTYTLIQEDKVILIEVSPP